MSLFKFISKAAVSQSSWRYFDCMRYGQDSHTVLFTQSLCFERTGFLNKSSILVCFCQLFYEVFLSREQSFSETETQRGKTDLNTRPVVLVCYATGYSPVLSKRYPAN